MPFSTVSAQAPMERSKIVFLAVLGCTLWLSRGSDNVSWDGDSRQLGAFGKEGAHDNIWARSTTATTMLQTTTIATSTQSTTTISSTTTTTNTAAKAFLAQQESSQSHSAQTLATAVIAALCCAVFLVTCCSKCPSRNIRRPQSFFF
mmetsp:Transcript_41103/g.76900  ORF Transcript_41103/g.76900 Transcript_41103/m.76900 type:complete len:147 (+) Transcript_41103:32-472(+)